MGVKPRPKYLLLARPKRHNVPSWWPKTVDYVGLAPRWVTVHEDGWTVGRNRRHALTQRKIETARKLFLDEYGPDDDGDPGIEFQFRVERI